MDASLRPRTPRRNRKPIKHLIGEMSRIACELRERVAVPPAAKQVSVDDFAQMLVCGLVTVLVNREQFLPATSWLLASAPDWQQDSLQEVFAAADLLHNRSCRWLRTQEIDALSNACDGIDWNAPDSGTFEAEHLYERFLAAHSASERRRKGVFFTPQPIVRFMLEQVDRQLRQEFGRADGIGAADVQLLDPAAGAGAFLTEAVTLVHQRFREGCLQAAGDDLAAGWSEYVVERLLPRLHGIELMPTSCLLAHLHVAIRLATTGFDFATPAPIRIAMGNALIGPASDNQANDCACVVVLGNPPFSYLSENDSPWIQGLIRGTGGANGYLEFDGERLGERKTWLHDDYVKFLRYAQWRVESAGSGIVAFVTNHGYLDNMTFRIMRRQLLRTFPRIAVIDLHGNRKKGEVGPLGEREENVFGLDQGVAIGFFRTSAAGKPADLVVEHAEVWGSSRAKLAALSNWAEAEVEFGAVAPRAPDYRWTPQAGAGHAEYACGIRLPDAMPVYTTAPVTARDGLVVAFSPDELLRRMERFCDLSISDDEVRRELFPRTRTARYPAGDTRGWKLSEARRRLAAETDLRPFVRRCLYRPFDWRFIFWHEAMIDWPRSEVMRHLLDRPAAVIGERTTRDNLALIARRQMLPSQPCAYFWVTDTLTLDGVIRSDNRGSEAVFPQSLLHESKLQLNLSADVQNQAGDSLASFAYALFHAPGYRTRYAEELRRDFPRVMIPKDEGLFQVLAALGQRLIELHLLRPNLESAEDAAVVNETAVGMVVAPKFPQFDRGWVFLDADCPIAECSESAWQWRVGGHQVLRKWLADRRWRVLPSEELSTYRRIIAAVEKTLSLLPEIESAVERHGGWEEAFQLE